MIIFSMTPARASELSSHVRPIKVECPDFDRRALSPLAADQSRITKPVLRPPARLALAPLG